MDLLSKNVSYLKGLAKGYGFDGEKDHTHHILLEIIDCLDLMAEEIKFLDGDFQRLEQYCEMIDSDLNEMERLFDDELDDYDMLSDYLDDWDDEDDWNEDDWDFDEDDNDDDDEDDE